MNQIKKQPINKVKRFNYQKQNKTIIKQLDKMDDFLLSNKNDDNKKNKVDQITKNKNYKK